MSENMNDNYQTPPPSLNHGPSQGLPPQKEGWERDVLEKLAFATLHEQRARR
ncbi:MAG: hypothetical protein JWQ23_2035, partial [Herminiimonas sp.]|nr:hypothetical protein [Herminiimonas sp.]